MAVSMTYGDYTFDPAPQLTLSLQHVRDEAGNLINIQHTASLDGKIISLGKTDAGPATLLGLQEDMRIALSDCSGCQLFKFECDNATLISAYATVNSLTFAPSSDNWVFTSNFSAELTWDSLSDNVLLSGTGIDTSCYSCLSNVDENWEIAIPEAPAYYFVSGCSGDSEFNRQSIEVTHTVSAKGFNCCISGVPQEGWINARTWVVDRLGFDSGILADVSGVFNFDPNNYNTYSHMRTNNVNKTTGDFSVTETWLLLNDSGSPLCLEEYSVEATTDISSRFIAVTIAGTITGLEVRDANFDITKSKIESAEECWANIQNLLYERATCLTNPMCPLRTSPIRTSVGKNPPQGTITYSYTYDSRVQLIPNSKTEQISISDELTSSQIAQVPIIGRRAGPLLVDLKVNNVLSRQVNISVLMEELVCPTGTTSSEILCGLYANPPTTAVEELLCCLESDLTSNYDQVFREADSQTFSPVDGQYSRSTSWIFQKCSGILGPQSFC